MISISRQYWFSAAHRLEGHPKCGRLHGHNYRVLVVLSGSTDADTGMVMDYGILDDIVKPIIDGKLDHRYIMSDDNEANLDPYGEAAAMNGHLASCKVPFSTAECIAEWIHGQIREALEPNYSHLAIVVRVDETPKSTAMFV